MAIPYLDGVPAAYYRPPAQPVVPPAQPQEKIHEVKPTERLEDIARQYTTPEAPVTAQQIAERNRLGDADQINPGQTLIIPTVKQHAEPTPAANQTPEQTQTDAAMQKYLTAEDNLAAVSANFRRDHNDPDYQSIQAGYQGQVATARSDLQAAIGNEIKADVQARSRPAGDIFDAKAIDQYGASVIKRYENDPAAKTAAEGAVKELKLQHEVDSALATARAASDAKGAVDSLSRDLPKLSPDAQARLFNSSEYTKLVDEKIAPEFTSPFQGEPWKDGRIGPGAKPMESLAKLRKLIEHADPRIAGDLTDRGLTALKDYQTRAEKDGYPITIGIEGTRALVHIAGQIGSTPNGQSLLQRMTDLPMDVSQIHLAVSEGARPDLLIKLAGEFNNGRILDSAISGVGMYHNNVMKGDVDALAKETEELSWLISNHGGSMTPDQLNQAIKDYTAGKGPDWEKKVQGLEEKVAGDGQTLLDQIESLRNAPPDRLDAANKAIENLLGDKKAQYAIDLALKKHPEYIDTTAGKRLMQNLAYGSKVGEQSLKLGRELANTQIRHNVLSAAEHFNPADPASRANALAAIDKMKDGTLAKLLGVSPSKLDNAADALKLALPTGQESAERVAGRLGELDKALQTDDLKPAFDKGLPAGQLIRTLGMTFAAVGFVNSANKALTDPTLKNDLKAIVDLASLGQKGSELMIGLGKISNDSLFGKFGSTASGRVFGFLSAGFDAWNAADAFFGAKPDAVKGALYTTSAVGGTLAAVSGTSFAASLGIGAWGGPVGIGLVVVSALGLSLKDRVDQSNLHMNGTSAAFLQHTGFSEAASNALVDQSGEGWSPMTMLQRYAEAKGYRLDDPAHRQPFVDWVNNMPADKLDKLRDQLHFALDDFDGDVGRLGNDPTVYRPTTFIHGGGGFPAKVNANVSTVGHIDAVVRDFGLPDLPRA